MIDYDEEVQYHHNEELGPPVRGVSDHMVKLVYTQIHCNKGLSPGKKRHSLSFVICLFQYLTVSLSGLPGRGIPFDVFGVEAGVKLLLASCCEEKDVEVAVV